MYLKRGISIWVGLLLCGIALIARLLLPQGSEQLRAVFFPDSSMERVYAVFAPGD